MALEAVVFPQDLLCCTLKEMYSHGGGSWGWEIGDELGDDQKTQGFYGNWEASSSSTPTPEMDATMVQKDNKGATSSGRRKRRRTRSLKNKEEVENQRMTHIAVERNRRKQMNEYLSVLRSLMPPFYVQKADQASIIGGAINFVKELEHLLQSLEVHKQLKHKQEENSVQDVFTTNPLASFFTFPQYSSTTKVSSIFAASIAATTINSADAMAANPSSVADIEVTMVENHANLKVLSKRRPKQLLKLVVGLQNIRLTTLHLSVNTVEPMVLYSFSLKVEDDCQMTSMDGIAAAVHRILERIHEEAEF